MSKKFKDYRWTTNRSVYNKLRKYYLEDKYAIHCAYCGYHKCENYTGKHYGGFDVDNLKYPNWKLVTKNRKQWMKKTIKIETQGYQRFWEKKPYYKITWDDGQF